MRRGSLSPVKVGAVLNLLHEGLEPTEVTRGIGRSGGRCATL